MMCALNLCREEKGGSSHSIPKPSTFLESLRESDQQAGIHEFFHPLWITRRMVGQGLMLHCVHPTQRYGNKKIIQKHLLVVYLSPKSLTDSRENVCQVCIWNSNHLRGLFGRLRDFSRPSTHMQCSWQMFEPSIVLLKKCLTIVDCTLKCSGHENNGQIRA